MKDSDSCLSIVVLGTLLIVAGILVDGFILSVVWNWFMPLIFGLPELTIVESLAVSLVAGLFVSTRYKSEKEYANMSELVAYFIVVSVLKLVLVLGFGWILLQLL